MLQNRHLKLVLAAAFLLLSACTLPSTAEPEPDPIEVDPGLARALDGSLAEILAQAPAPGLTAAIQFSDGSRWSGAAGTTHPADHPEAPGIVTRRPQLNHAPALPVKCRVIGVKPEKC